MPPESEPTQLLLPPMTTRVPLSAMLSCTPLASVSSVVTSTCVWGERWGGGG